MLMNRKGWDKFRIGRERDRRIKLTDEERQDIYNEYHRGGIGMRPLAKRYGVERTTIRNIVRLGLYQRTLEERKKNKVWLKYYDTKKHKEYMRTFRKHIRELL